jgi:uncharacterized protein (DUF1800 family)
VQASTAQDPVDRVEPWTAAGLSELDAARHVLRRLAYGARPGEAEQIAATGVRRWIDLQLGLGPDGGSWAPAALSGLPYLSWSAEDLVAEHGTRPRLRKQALSRRLVNAADLDGANGVTRQRDAEAVLQNLAMASGMAEGESGGGWNLVQLMRHQRLVRGLVMEAQLHEVLTDFWFNHFNVSANKSSVMAHLVSYERDAIRPNLFGPFRDLLAATARHPAMLGYLDNSSSRAANDIETALDFAMRPERLGPLSNPTLLASAATLLRWQEPEIRRTTMSARDNLDIGINENYARELLELHTLGVDGGYSPRDVIEVARALTGWSTLPYHGTYRSRFLGLLAEEELASQLGFVRDGEFLFRPDWHDAGPKRILGYEIEEGGGYADGAAVLDLLAVHPATARRIAYKLGQRFVSNPPPERLVREVARRFEGSGGDLTECLRALIDSEDFWREQPVPLRKTPLEFLLTALRGLDARPVSAVSPRSTSLSSSLTAMGQPLYSYDPPTGFPAVEDSWFTSGALLERANLASRIAFGQVPELVIDFEALAGPEPFLEQGQALTRALDLLLPARDEKTDERFQEAFALQRLAPRLWFSVAVGLVLASPEFQLR